MLRVVASIMVVLRAVEDEREKYCRNQILVIVI